MKFDVVVVGGGVSGVCAAVSAVQNGASVCIIEQTGVLGGLGTTGLMSLVISSKYHLGGISKEIVDTLKMRGATNPYLPKNDYEFVPYQVEEMKLLLDEKIIMNDITLYLYSRVYDVDVKENKLTAVKVAGPEGNFVIEGITFIDATGDAMLSLYCGEEYELGNEKGETQAPTMVAYYSNVDHQKLNKFLEEECNGDFQNAVEKYVPLAVEEGVLSMVDFHHPGAFPITYNANVVNAGHIYGADCVTASGMTKATLEGRRMARQYYNFYKKYIPGFENAEYMITGSTLGLRETRRIIGKYVTCYEDKISYRKFEDGVIRYDGGPASDLHASSNDMKAYLDYFNMFTDKNDIRSDDFALLPYRSFQAVKTKNLLVAGRCLSADRVVHARVRVMGYCMEMGQVTGTAAAMLKDRNGITDDIDIKALQAKLRAGGLLNV